MREMEESLAKLNSKCLLITINLLAFINELCNLVQPLLTPPCEFTMTEYSKHKRERRKWFSPPFYSGPGGYKLCLCVVNYPQDLQIPYILSVYVYLMRGEHDDRLVWPFHGDITVQLVTRQLFVDQDQQNMKTFKFSKRSLISSCSRVTSGERAKSGCEERFGILWVEQSFIKDDCVKLRVTTVICIAS